MGLFSKKKKKKNSPFELDWGKITPDGYNSNENKALYVFNHHFLNEESRRLSRIFAGGRVNWYSNHLPGNCKNELLLDIRGQDEVTFELQFQEEWGKGIKEKNTKLLEQDNLIVEFLI